MPVQKTLISSPKIDQNLAKGAVFREKTAVFEDLCLLISTYAYFVRRSFHTPYVNPRHKSSRFSRGGGGSRQDSVGFSGESGHQSARQPGRKVGGMDRDCAGDGERWIFRDRAGLEEILAFIVRFWCVIDCKVSGDIFG